MKRTIAIVIALALLATFAVIAAQPNAYQVTGIVKAVTPSMISVDKGKENFQIARDAGTKVTGNLKVGAKVTVEYRMTATSVAVK